MSAIPTRSKKANIKTTTALIAGISAAIGISLFVYLMWYVSPDEVMERVEIIAVTDAGCIAETYDGYPINIGPCNAESGEFIVAPIDQKVKERAALMNPTGQ